LSNDSPSNITFWSYMISLFKGRKNDRMLFNRFQQTLFSVSDSGALSDLDNLVLLSSKIASFSLGLLTIGFLAASVFTGLESSDLTTLALSVFGLILSSVIDIGYRYAMYKHLIYLRFKIIVFGIYSVLNGIPIAVLGYLYNISAAIYPNSRLALGFPFVVWFIVFVVLGFMIDNRVRSSIHLWTRSILLQPLQPFYSVVGPLLSHKIFRYRILALQVATSISFIILSWILIDSAIMMNALILILGALFLWPLMIREGDFYRFVEYRDDKKNDILSYILETYLILNDAGISNYRVLYTNSVYTATILFSTVISPENLQPIKIIHTPLQVVDPIYIQTILWENWENHYQIFPLGSRDLLRVKGLRTFIDSAVLEQEKVLWELGSGILIEFSSKDIERLGEISDRFCKKIW
jgi:hypothetical protein